MSTTIEKLSSIEQRISSKKDRFRLFALFLREDAPNRWDLVVSAPWLDENEQKGLNYLVKQIKLDLTTQEFVWLSRIIVAREGSAILEAMKQVEGSHLVLQNVQLPGILVKEAYIISSHPKRTRSNAKSSPPQRKKAKKQKKNKVS